MSSSTDLIPLPQVCAALKKLGCEPPPYLRLYKDAASQHIPAVYIGKRWFVASKDLRSIGRFYAELDAEAEAAADARANRLAGSKAGETVTITRTPGTGRRAVRRRVYDPVVIERRE